MLKEQIANYTLAWSDEDKFTFIWDYDLVIVYVNPEHGYKKVISNHAVDALREIDVLRDIYVWLDSDPKLPTNPFKFEGEYGTETDWD